MYVFQFCDLFSVARQEEKVEIGVRGSRQHSILAGSRQTVVVLGKQRRREKPKIESSHFCSLEA